MTRSRVLLIALVLVAGGVGSFWLISRNSTKQFGITSAETFIAENVGAG